MSQENRTICLYQRLNDAYRNIIYNSTYSLDSNLDQAIKNRLLQFLTNYYFICFRAAIPKRPEILKLTQYQIEQKIDKRRLTFDINTPRSRTKTIGCKLYEYLKFWILWCAMLFGLLKFWGPHKITSSAPGSLIYGCLEGNNNSPAAYKRIQKYLDESSKEGISGSVFFVFKSQKFFHKLTNKMTGSRFPEALFAFHSSFRSGVLANLLRAHIFGVIESHACLIRHPVISDIFSEFATFRVIEKMEMLGHLRATLFSTSNIPNHHLTSNVNKSSITHHIYYSCMPTNPVKKSDKEPMTATLEPLLLTPINGTHWVWSDQDRHLLSKSYKQKDVRTGGVPALFYSMPEKSDLSALPEYDFVIFDVTPINIEKLNPYELSYYYGRYENAIELVNNTLWAVDSASKWNGISSFTVALKPKRNKQDFHDLRYWDDVQDLEKKHDNFRVLDAEDNIENLFHPMTIFISRPFTSAAHLAAMSGSKSIYHDPNGEIVDTSVKIKNLTYSSGKENLAQVLNELIKKKNYKK